MTTIVAGPQQVEIDQLESPYVAREFSLENEEAKQPQRERVAQNLLGDHDERPLRLFGMPGLHWSFEHLVEKLRGPKASNFFLGVERNRTILDEGLTYVPGLQAFQFVEQTKAGVFHGFEGKKARILWAGCASFMNLGRQYKGGKAARRSWARRYKRWTAVWLDFQSPIGVEIITSLQRLEEHLDMTRQVIPVAVTFMIGREFPAITRDIEAVATGDSLARRVKFLELLLSTRSRRTWSFRDAWSYESAGGCPMGVLCGTMTLRPDLVQRDAVEGEREEDLGPVLTKDLPVKIDSRWVSKDGDEVVVIGFASEAHRDTPSPTDKRARVRYMRRINGRAVQILVKIADFKANFAPKETTP